MILFISKKKYKVIEQAVQDLADNQKKIAEEGKNIAETSFAGFTVTLLCLGFILGLLLKVIGRW